MQPYSVYLWLYVIFTHLIPISIARSYLMYNNSWDNQAGRNMKSSPVTDLTEKTITRWALHRVTRLCILLAARISQKKENMHCQQTDTAQVHVH